MNTPGHHEDGPGGYGEPPVDLALLRGPDEAEQAWRSRLAATGVRVIPAPVREARSRASLRLAQRDNPSVTPDRCARRSDGALAVYDRPALEPGARRLRTISPEVVREHLALATRAALTRAGLIARPTEARSIPRSRETRLVPGRRRPGQAPPLRGDPSGPAQPDPSRPRRGATLRLLIDALVRESPVWAEVGRAARAAWEVAP